MISGEKQMWS